MPSAVNSAYGQALNFMPQGKQGFTSQFGSIGQGNFTAPTDNTMGELSNNLEKLRVALGDQSLAQEKYMNEKGLRDAQNMINSATPEDIKKMNVIDYAQRAGLADSASNPYFKAYSEKLRGNFLSSMMKQEYDAKYEMSPAKSADEERARYEDFAAKWKDSVNSADGTPANTQAFDVGYNEAKLVDSKNLVDAWQKKEYETQTTTLMASTQSKLAGLITNSVELLKTPGAMTTAAQNILNEPRLMGLPMSARVQLVDNWSQEMIKTGHMDAGRTEQMMNSLTLAANPDGTTVKAADVVDMQQLRTEAVGWRRQFLTKDLTDWADKYVKNKDFAGAQKDVEQMMKDNPDEAPMYGAQLNNIEGRIQAIKNKEEAARQAALNKAAKAFDGDTTLRNNFKAWMEGSIRAGNAVTGVLSKVPEETKSNVFWESLDYYMTAGDMSPTTRMKYVSNCLAYPGFADYRSKISDRYMTDIRNITVNDDGSPAASDTAKMLVSMRIADPQNFAASFGSQLDGSVSTISGLADNHNGDVGAALQDYAKYNSLDKDQKESFQSDIQETMKSSWYNMEGFHSLGGGQTSTVRYDNDTDTTARLKDQATVYMAGGASAAEALQMAGSQLMKSHAYYHGAIIPMGAFNNMQTPDDEAYAKAALDRNVYNFANDAGVGAADVDVRYDSRQQVFFISGGGQQTTVSVQRIRDGGYDIYAEDANNGGEGNNTQMTAEDVNASRATGGAAYSKEPNWKAVTPYN